MKKITTTFLSLAIALAAIPLLSAFEAHVINVTAQIENNVECIVVQDDIDFGTVFPQEALDRTFTVELSQTFIDNPEHDILEYSVEQEPKCWNENAGSPLFGETEIVEGEYVCIDEGFTKLPILCPYLSKTEITDDGNAGENDGPPIPAFHGTIIVEDWDTATASSTATFGVLQKTVEDFLDEWNVDLKVPCFFGQCAQDWDGFVEGVNPEANPDDFVQPAENEGLLFGCNIRIFITGKPPTVGCLGAIDLMLVLDRSGSISSTELQDLKDAANAFITALAPVADGVHIGQSSFATSGTLDLHLTDDEAAAHAAVNALVSGSQTNLKAGIDLATAELDDAHEHERPAEDDVMVIITDGAPNRPFPTSTADDVAAAAADAARAAGVEIFVLGVGVTASTETYLKDNIADDAAHYFSVANFADLEAALVGLAECE